MGILLAFAPFIAFAIIDRLVSGAAGLVAGAAVSAILVSRDLVAQVRPKLLELGTLALFSGLALYAVLSGESGSIFGVRLRVDGGLLLLVLLSLAVRRPFTLQYARASVAPEFWNTQRFIDANYVITAAWALAFAVLAIIDAVMAYTPGLSPRVGIVATVAALLAAYKFTGWYPNREEAATASPSGRGLSRR